MNKIEFVQQHLIEKGVPADLTKFNSNSLIKVSILGRQTACFSVEIFGYDLF